MIAGLSTKLVNVRAVNIPVLKFATNQAATLEKLLRIGQEEVEHHCADSFVLGCMAFLQVAEEMHSF